MPFRSILLRVLFGSLALAALFGAAGILVASHEATWDVVGTSIATAVAALLLLIASRAMDRPASRPASLLASTLIVIEYLLTLGAIWQLERIFGSSGRFDDSLWLTVLFIAMVGIPAIVFMRMATAPTTVLAGYVGLVLAGIELAMLLAMQWGTSSWSANEYLAELAGFLVLFGLITVICLIGIDFSPQRSWQWLGVSAAALGYALTAYGVIRQLNQGSQVVVSITCLAAAIAHANIVVLCALRPGQRWLRWLTIGAGTSAALFIALASGSNATFDIDNILPRLAAACGIVAGCGTLALIILARLNRKFIVPPNAMTGVSDITLFCPICRKKQTVPLNGAACDECRVLIHVRVEEPKCEKCGYSLLMLKSAVCPECGTPVPTTRPPAEPQTAPLGKPLSLPKPVESA
jgi:hypothetical protein